jgi:hypothetical protein
MSISSSYERVKSTVQACYAAPLGKILLGVTALGIAAASASNALRAEETAAKAGHAALGALGILSAFFLTKEFNRVHGDDLRELRSILAR